VPISYGKVIGRRLHRTFDVLQDAVPACFCHLDVVALLDDALEFGKLAIDAGEELVELTRRVLERLPRFGVGFHEEMLTNGLAVHHQPDLALVDFSQHLTDRLQAVVVVGPLEDLEPLLSDGLDD